MLAQIAASYPDMFLESSSTSEGVTSYTVCLEAEPPGSSTCSVAGTNYLRYFPAGVGWECDAGEMWTSCNPDYSDAHDTSQPRLVLEYNHQQDEDYHDSPPMYRQ